MNDTTWLMTRHYITCSDGKRRLAYTHWGDPDNPQVVICVHGLTRNNRDFDFLASQLAANYRVICPNMAGRGDSDCATSPEEYDYPLYLNDIFNLFKQLGLQQVSWIGTSMGGLIGMMVAAQSPSLIQCLVLNDVGPFIPQAELQRIAQKLMQPFPTFTTLLQVKQFLRLVHNQFGPLTDEQWEHLARHSSKLTPEGHYQLAYDPNLSQVFLRFCGSDMDIWQVWAKITCPILVLRGEQSELLTEATIEQMQATRTNVQVARFAEVGHAPALMDDEQIQVVESWLKQGVSL
jgi:pimeloyl-ACP methyl ester carboxylesterase